MSAQVIIQDKTHNPFIIFGGLFSRALVTTEIELTKKPYDYSGEFENLLAYVDKVSSETFGEERLRTDIASYLLRGVSATLPRNSQRDIIYKGMVIEVKNSIKEFDLDIIKGSIKHEKYGRVETAIEELFRYLNSDKTDWGVLTTGRIFRFYNRHCTDQYIEFDLFDIAASRDIDHFNFFKHLLICEEYRFELYQRTKVIREDQAKNHIKYQLDKFLTEHEKKNREKAVEKIKTFLSILSIRYLEDIGCLPVLNPKYAKYSMRNPEIYTSNNLIEAIEKFQNGDWHRGKKQILLNPQDMDDVRKTLESSVNLKKLQACFSDYQEFDYSDILIDQLGGVYQEIVNKNSEGAYYTPFVIGKKISTYLKSLSEVKKIDFENDDNKVIVDIACGSGQLLRALVPSSHLFFKSKGDYKGKNSLRRLFIQRLVGIDKDPNSVFICKVSLSLFAAELENGLSIPKLVKMEDTLEAFCESRSNFLEIKRSDIFSIVTNPPWESL